MRQRHSAAVQLALGYSGVSGSGEGHPEIGHSRLMPSLTCSHRLPTAATGGWATTTQMTPGKHRCRADRGAIGRVEPALRNHYAQCAHRRSAELDHRRQRRRHSTAPNFSVAIGSEILLVNAISGMNNTTWTVVARPAGPQPRPPLQWRSRDTNRCGLERRCHLRCCRQRSHCLPRTALANDVTHFILNTFVVPGYDQLVADGSHRSGFHQLKSPDNTANFPSQFLAIQLFDKIGVLVRGLKFVVADLTWLVTNAAVYGGLDFTQLPVTTPVGLALSLLLTTLLMVQLARLFDCRSAGIAHPDALRYRGPGRRAVPSRRASHNPRSPSLPAGLWRISKPSPPRSRSPFRQATCNLPLTTQCARLKPCRAL